jgi:hypothetical protein
MKEANSPLAKLIGRRVSMGISEPWEFGNAVPDCRLVGEIVAVHIVTQIRGPKETIREQLLVHIEKPFAYKRLKTEYLLASPRHEGYALLQFADGEPVSFNFLRASAERASSEDALDGRRWKEAPSFCLIGGMGIQDP